MSVDAKRLFDIILTLLVAPAALMIIGISAAAVMIDSPGGAFFCQQRVGRGGRIFTMHKLRTMRRDQPPDAPRLTVAGDARITRIGRFLRRSKLDELPQIWDVFIGNMSWVGPRPETPEFMALYSAQVREEILSVRPGITDCAAIAFRREEDLLAQESDPLRAYTEEIMPRKQEFYLEYVRRHSPAGDLRILWNTLRALFRRDD